MLLREAKEILKKNGYIVEAYDAVTDRNNIKDKRNYKSYFVNALVRLKNALAEEGIRSTVSGESKNALKFGRYKVTIYNYKTKRDNITDYDKNNIGPESGEDASYIQMDNSVILRLWHGDTLIDEQEFDVRNTPSMVNWILEHIEG